MHTCKLIDIIDMHALAPRPTAGSNLFRARTKTPSHPDRAVRALTCMAARAALVSLHRAMTCTLVNRMHTDLSEHVLTLRGRFSCTIQEHSISLS